MVKEEKMFKDIFHRKGSDEFLSVHEECVAKKSFIPGVKVAVP